MRLDADALMRLVLVRDPGVAQRIETCDDAALAGFIAACRDNVVLLRAWRSLKDLGVARDALDAAADAERARVDRTVVCVGGIAEALDGAGVAYVLPKAFQHAPDMGHDIDVLVGGDAAGAADALARSLGARPTRGSRVSRFAGKRAYDILGVGPMELHDGRVGQVGEHVVLARALLARRRRGWMGPVAAWVPSAEDQLLLQVVQRVASHRRIRASDALLTMELARSSELDRGYVTAAARVSGITGALRWYLAAVEAIERRVRREGAAARPAAPAARTWGYEVPLTPVLGAYLSAFAEGLRRGRLGSAARIAAIPVLLVATAVDRARG